jgi:hypothetical protein
MRMLSVDRIDCLLSIFYPPPTYTPVHVFTMWILPLVGYLGVIVGFSFLTLAIGPSPHLTGSSLPTNTPSASGLYYLSELVEEHTVLASRLLSRLIYLIISLQVLLILIDRFPLFLSLLSIVSHLVYASNLRRFPIVKLSDPLFILSCILVILNHWLWFRHFSTPPNTGYSYGTGFGAGVDVPSFTEIASYFGLCVWLVPFSLFVSLSAGENVLPSMGSEYATGDRGAAVGGSQGGGLGGGDKGGSAKRSGMAKAVVDGVREWVGETGELMGFWRGEKTRRF